MSIWDVDRRVDDLATSMVTKFYPSAMAKMTGLPLPIVFERLLQLVSDGRLCLEFQVICPHCSHTVRTIDTQEQLLSHELMCDRCGETFWVNEDCLFPVFRVTPSYKEDVKKNMGVPLVSASTLRLTHTLSH